MRVQRTRLCSLDTWANEAFLTTHSRHLRWPMRRARNATTSGSCEPGVQSSASLLGSLWKAAAGNIFLRLVRLLPPVNERTLLQMLTAVLGTTQTIAVPQQHRQFCGEITNVPSASIA